MELIFEIRYITGHNKTKSPKTEAPFRRRNWKLQEVPNN